MYKIVIKNYFFSTNSFIFKRFLYFLVKFANPDFFHHGLDFWAHVCLRSQPNPNIENNKNVKNISTYNKKVFCVKCFRMFCKVKRTIRAPIGFRMFYGPCFHGD